MTNTERQRFEAAMKEVGWQKSPITDLWVYLDDVGPLYGDDDEMMRYWCEHGAAYRPPPF